MSGLELWWITASSTFQPGAQLTPHAISWKQLGVNTTEVVGIFIGQTEAGLFRLAIDDVQLR